MLFGDFGFLEIDVHLHDLESADHLDEDFADDEICSEVEGLGVRNLGICVAVLCFLEAL